MKISAKNLSVAPVRQDGEGRRRRWHVPRVFTPCNFIAVAMCLGAFAVVISTIIPYEVFNSSKVCTHCGGFEYLLTRTYGGIPISDDRTFAHTKGSRLYEQLVSPRHRHQWMLGGECIGTGNILEPRTWRMVKGEGMARSRQIEQSLMALNEFLRRETD